jgi:AraC-like DNA-binding protein
METYSADALPAASRALEWTDLYSRQLNRVEFTPEDRHSFAARLSLGKLGPIQFVRMSTNRTDIRRTRRHIVPGAPRLYSFLLQAKGSSVFQHCGQEAHLGEGDFTLRDSAAPHSFAVEDSSTVIMLRVDGTTLREYLPTPERFCGLRLRHEIGLTAPMAALVEKLDARLEECAKQIRNPAWTGHTLTEIAFGWGFNSAAHFTRTFHEQFGMAPREYRRVAQH